MRTSRALVPLSFVCAGVLLSPGHSGPALTASVLASEACNGKLDLVTAKHSIDTDAWSDCTGRYRSSFSIPAAARGFPFKRTLLKRPYGGYDPNIEKLDIVWIDDAINVDAPLKSFGGDIILFGDTININAPIDSRPYIEQDVDILGSTEPAYRGPWTIARADNRQTTGGITVKPKYVGAYRDYYLKCFDCAKGDSRFPRMPSGLAAPEATGAGLDHPVFTGSDAPEDQIDWTQARSGNIYVFGRVINIADSLQGAGIPPYRSECTLSRDVYRPYALNAGGAVGGLGGPGSPSQCINHPPPSTPYFDCPVTAYTTAGGLSGNGGRGADAGTIAVTLTGLQSGEALTTLRSRLTAVSDVLGGASGPNVKLRTPSAEGRDAADGTRCSFRSQAQLPDYPSSQTGTPGMLKVAVAPAVAALSQVASLLAAKDARTDYDGYTELVIAKANPEIESLSPSASLSQYLSRELVRAQLAFAEDLQHLLNGLPLTGAYLSPVFKGIASPGLEDAAFADQQLAVVRSLAQFDNSDGLIGVLRQTGGLFRVVSRASAVSRMTDKQLRVGIVVGNLELTEINEGVRNFNEQVFSYIAEQERVPVQARIDALNKAIAAAEDAARANSNQDMVKGVLASLQEVGKAGKAFITALGASEVDPVAAAVALQSGAEAVQGLFNSTSSVQSGGDTTDLREKLDAATHEYDLLCAYVAREKDAYLSEKYNNLAELLKRRQSIQSSLTAESFLFTDLLKVAAIGYLDDPFTDRSNFNSNVEALRTYLGGFPTREPYINLNEISWACDAPRDCLTIPPSTSWREVSTNIQVGKGAIELPLYVIGPASKEQRLRVFSYDPEQLKVAVIAAPKQQ